MTSSNSFIFDCLLFVLIRVIFVDRVFSKRIERSTRITRINTPNHPNSSFQALSQWETFEFAVRKLPLQCGFAPTCPHEKDKLPYSGIPKGNGLRKRPRTWPTIMTDIEGTSIAPSKTVINASSNGLAAGGQNEYAIG